MTAPKFISLPVSEAFHKRARAVRAFRRACSRAYRETGNDIYITGGWVLPYWAIW